MALNETSTIGLLGKKRTYEDQESGGDVKRNKKEDGRFHIFVASPEIGEFEPANVKSSGIFNLAAKTSNAKGTKKMYEE